MISSRGLAVALLFGATVLAVPAQPASGAALGDILHFDSVDDFVGKGSTVTVTPPTGGISIYGLTTASRLVLYANDGAEGYWFLDFSAPAGETLHVGSYLNAQESKPLGHGGIAISGNGSGCNETLGDFDIHALTTDGAGVPTAVAISFDQRCEPNESLGLLAGYARVGSSVAIASLSVPHVSAVFQDAVSGAVGQRLTFTIGADGELPVTVGQLTMGGTDGSDYPIVDDGCSGGVLAPGDTCTYTVGFDPTASGPRHGALTIPSDMAIPTRELRMLGMGLIPTTTSVSIRPDWTYNRPGIVYEVHVAAPQADPYGGLADCVVDGVNLGPTGVTPNSTGACYGPRTLGSHTFQASFRQDSFNGASQSPVLTFDVTPTTVLSLSATPGVSTGTLVSATVSTSGGLLYPGGTLTLRDDTTKIQLGVLAIDGTHPTLAVTAALALGSHHLSATYGGVAGILDPSTAALDMKVLPAPGPPMTGLVSKSVAGATDRISFSWVAPAGVAVNHYDLQVSTDGGAYVDLGPAVSSPAVRSLASAHAYRVRVRARDAAGNGSAWAYGAPFHLTAYSEASTRITYAGTWYRAVSSTYLGGGDRYARVAGASARFSFTGRIVGWVATYGPTSGSARVYVDGVLVATVNLYAAKVDARRVVWQRTFASTGSHVLTIRVLGTAGHPKVDIDAFLVIG